VNLEVKKQFSIADQLGVKLVPSLREYGTFDYGVMRAVGGLHNEPSINLGACGSLQTT